MGRLWKTARFVLEGSEIRTTRFPTGYTGVWKTLILDREFWEYGMPEQANIHQITTTGFPHPSLRCEGTRRRRRDTLFNCQGSDGIQNGSLFNRQKKEVDSEQTDYLIPSSGNAFRHFFSHLEFPCVTFSSGPIWPKTGGPIPGEN